MWEEHGLTSIWTMWGFSQPCLAPTLLLSIHIQCFELTERGYLPAGLGNTRRWKHLRLHFYGGKNPLIANPLGKQGEELEILFRSPLPISSNTAFLLFLKMGSVCQNPFLNCSFRDGKGQQLLLQSSFQSRDGFHLLCSQGHGSTFLSYISQLLKATRVSTFSYTSKWLRSHLLIAHKFQHFLFIRKYMIFWLVSSTKPQVSLVLLCASTKIHYIAFMKNMNPFC